MKKILALLVVSVVLIAGCGDSEEGGKEKEGGSHSADDYSEMVEMSLDTFALDVNIMVPEYEGPMNTILAQTLIEVEEGWLWNISIGDEGAKYSLFIEDVTGYETDHTVAKKKEELAGMNFMDIKYVVDDADFVMYEKLYPGDESIPAQYHVMGVLKKGDATYKIYSDETVMFNKRLADKMLLSIKSALQATS